MGCGAGVETVRKCRGDRPLRISGATWPGLGSRLGPMRLGSRRRPMNASPVFYASTYPRAIYALSKCHSVLFRKFSEG